MSNDHAPDQEQAGEAVALGDLVVVTRGQSGYGSDDKRYLHF